MSVYMIQSEVLQSLIDLSREVGRPEAGLVILGEGKRLQASMRRST